MPSSPDAAASPRNGVPARIEITLLCHAATAAIRAGRFPHPDDTLDTTAQSALGRVSFRPRGRQRCLTSPAHRAVATATALGLKAAPEPLLDDADPGRWAGLSLADLATADPAGLSAWLNLDAPPPGGEAPSAILARVARWLEGQRPGPGIVAVTHAAVIRAAVTLALDAPAVAMRHIDVAPLTLTRLSGSPGHWRLSCLGVPLGAAD